MTEQGRQDQAARVTVWVMTHRGEMRPRNEDAVGAGLRLWTGTMDSPATLTGTVDEIRIVTVSDGIGGGRAGNEASRLACRWLAEAAFESTPEHEWGRLLEQINARMTATARTQREWCGMGATVAGVRLHSEVVEWFNVGDSRVYRVRDGYVRQLSIDDRGSEKHIVTQAIGGTMEPTPITPHVGREAVVEGWQYLLCSDGLTTVVGIDTIEARLAEGGAHAVRGLVEDALAGGGPDNVSVALVRVDARDGNGTKERRTP